MAYGPYALENTGAFLFMQLFKISSLGGDAIFASMYSAFKSPEDTEKTKAERLIALHSVSELTSFYEKEALKALPTEKTPVKNHG